MKVIQEAFDFNPEKMYPLSGIADRSEILFFDIETTGFSAKTAEIYLIGCVWYGQPEDGAGSDPSSSGGGWQLIQWFAETPDDESDVITAFFDFLSRFRVLIHFNGDMFDIPFITGRCAHLGIRPEFDAVESFDIFRKIRPLRSFFGLDSLKQKSVERFLGIRRTDEYTGGQLIEVYREYVSHPTPARLHLLLLHNADDLRGMPEILPILFYPDLLTRAEFRFLGIDIPKSAGNRPEAASPNDIPASEDHPDADFPDAAPANEARTNADFPDVAPANEARMKDSSPSGNNFAELRFQSSVAVPCPVEWEETGFFTRFERNEITVRLPLYSGELKHFYPDYRNYYYLPAEDCAYHKSVAEFVEKSARKKATAKTCYTRTSGVFLPVPSGIFPVTFREDYKSTPEFCEAKEDLFRKTDLSGFLPCLFSGIRAKLLN